MVHSTQTPDYSKPAPKPLPSVDATRRAIVAEVMRDTVDAYERARQAQREAEARYGGDFPLDPMMQVISHRFLDAERTLIRAILSIKPEGGIQGAGCQPETRLWTPRGVLYGGRYYVVSPDPDASAGMKVGEKSETGEEVMVLTSLDRDDMDCPAVLDLDPAEVPTAAPTPAEADEDLDDDDEPAPKPSPPRQVWGRGDAVPRPLLRQTLTIVPPWDNGSDVTLQVIVLAEASHDDDVTARRKDVPELAEAGWSWHSMKALSVFTRVLG